MPPALQHNHSTATNISSDPFANTSDQIRALLREVHDLRDQQRRQDGFLSRINADKRKLEDDLSRLHSTRRKLERQVDGLQNQLTKTQKSEHRARDQLQREIMLRRRAEEVVNAERAKRRDLETRRVDNDAPKCTADALMATAYT